MTVKTWREENRLELKMLLTVPDRDLSTIADKAIEEAVREVSKDLGKYVFKAARQMMKSPEFRNKLSALVLQYRIKL